MRPVNSRVGAHANMARDEGRWGTRMESLYACATPTKISIFHCTHPGSNADSRRIFKLRQTMMLPTVLILELLCHLINMWECVKKLLINSCTEAETVAPLTLQALLALKRGTGNTTLPVCINWVICCNSSLLVDILPCHVSPAVVSGHLWFTSSVNCLFLRKNCHVDRRSCFNNSNLSIKRKID